MNQNYFIMLIGLPGSGKSTWAESFIRDRPDGWFKGDFPEFAYHSSDAIREELFGDEEDQTHNVEVFEEMRKRVKRDLSDGKSIIYDATNLSKRRRIAFLREIKSFNVVKQAILFITPYKQCLAQNAKRNRVVPDHAMRKMYMSFEPPHFSEGWDSIELIENIDEEYDTIFDLRELFSELDKFNQKNNHHSKTLGEHCRAANDYILKHKSNDEVLAMAALLHDVGKVETQSRLNKKGEFDGNYHYYQHHCVGAYESIFYMCEMAYDLDEILQVSNLIFYHMHPYCSWKQSEKAKARDKRLIGDAMFNDILLLHDADVFAH